MEYVRETLSISDQRGAKQETSLVRSYMPELDSARGLAILLVLFYHGLAPPANAQTSGFARLLLQVSQFGWAGVNLFFVLSGFLITGILLESRTRPDYFRRFYIRRALRILPALYATLAVLLVGGWISWRFAILSAFFLANSAPLLGIPLQYGPLWSLAVEEHFYLLWPSAIRNFSDRALAWLAVIVVAVSPAVRLIGFFVDGRPTEFIGLYTWYNLDGLALGALLAMWLRRPAHDCNRLSWISVALMAAGSSGFVLCRERPPLQAALLATSFNVGFLGLLLGMLLLGTSRWRPLVDRPILKFLGFISYGLYLLHVLAFRLAEILLARPLLGMVLAQRTAVAMLVRFCTGAALAIGVAYLSRRSLEERFLRIGFGSRMTMGSSDPTVHSNNDVSVKTSSLFSPQ